MRKPTYEELETRIKELEIGFQKQQKAEQDIREAEMQSKFFMNTLPDIVYRLDKEGNIIQVNKAVEKYGYKIEEVQGRSIFEFVHFEDREKVQYRINERRTGDRATKDLEVRLFTKEGEEKIVETRATVVTENFFKVVAEGLYTSDKPAKDSFFGTFGVARDITERKHIEDDLRSELYKLKALTNGLDKIGVSIDIVDLDYNIVYQTEQLIETFGESIGKSCYEVYMGLNQPCEQCPMEKAIKSKSVQSIEVKGKNERFYHVYSIPFINPNGTIDKVIEIVQDETERKNAEKSIIEQKEFTETAVNALTDTFFVFDPANGKAIRWNRNFNRVTGYSDEEIASMKAPDDWYSIEDLKKAEETIEKIFQEGHAILEMSLITKSGKTVPTEYSAVMIKDDEGNPKYIIAIGRDITDRKKAEVEAKKLQEQLIQAQKMESIGRLAGGIAHDFNNILVGIMGYAELLKMKFNNPSTKEGQAVDVIIQGTVRAADLTKQLLGFARGGKYNPMPLNINSVIEDTVRVLEKIFEKNINVEYDFETHLNTIEADENQMNQILTNIIINAKDAMPYGGNLIFKTENVYFDEEYTKVNPEVKSGLYVKISITDTGTGMTKEVKNSMFEPFYSTKGKGTGLGLATVYGIVNNHGGHINVYSEPGEGTIFTLYFHVTDREVKKKEKVAAIIKGEATILVVDDEEHVRNFTEQVLKELGYEVMLAKNGKEAIKIYEEKNNEIDLVLLDMIMPEMAGRETNIRLRNINPDVRVLLSSGYSQNGTATEILNEGAVDFVQKPFKIQELSKVISDILKNKL